MYVRIARFEGATPEQAEAARNLGKEQFLPQVQQLDGYGGSAMLGDVEAGTALNLVFFDTPEALEAGDRELDSMSPPDELSGIRRTSIERYEVAIHEIGDHPAAARVTRLTGAADRIDEGIRHALETILPRARALDGWQGVFFLVDRDTGNGIIVTLWESAEARQASEDAATQLRHETAAAGGETIIGIERYEVVALDARTRAGIS